MKSFKNAMVVLILVSVLLVVVPVAIYKSSPRHNIDLFSEGYHYFADEAVRKLDELPKIIEEKTEEIARKYGKHAEKYIEKFEDIERKFEHQFR